MMILRLVVVTVMVASVMSLTIMTVMKVLPQLNLPSTTGKGSEFRVFSNNDAKM